MDHLHRGEPEHAEQPVEHAVVLQNAHPRVGAHQHVHPGGHRDEQDHDRVAAAGELRDDVGDRVAEHDADERGDERDVERAPEHREKDRIGHKALEIIQRELEGQHVVAGGGERVEDDQQHRHDDHGRDPEHIRIGHRTKLLHH